MQGALTSVTYKSVYLAKFTVELWSVCNEAEQKILTQRNPR